MKLSATGLHLFEKDIINLFQYVRRYLKKYKARQKNWFKKMLSEGETKNRIEKRS